MKGNFNLNLRKQVRLFTLCWLCLQISANQKVKAEGWIFPHHTSQVDDNQYASSQKLDAFVRGVTSKNFEFRLTLPPVEFASNEVEVYSVTKTMTGEYSRETVILSKNKVGDWLVARKEISPLDTEKAKDAHDQMRKFIMEARFSYDGMGGGLDSLFSLLECQLRPDQNIVLQAMVISLPSDPTVYSQYRKIMDVVMGEMPPSMPTSPE